MRFVWAVAAFVLATLMVGAGIAQRTVLQGPKTETEAIQIDEEAPYVLVDGSVLNSHDGTQTFHAEGDGTIFAAYARTADATAWLARSDYVLVTRDGDEIVSTFVPASVGEDSETDGGATPAPTEEAPAEGDAASGALTPMGSDLWLEEFEEQDLLETSLALPEDASLLLASDGVDPAPTQLSVTWPTGATAPFSGPLIVGGIIMLVIGIGLYILGLRKLRRSKGPRRRGLPMPATEPIDLSVEAEDKGVISAEPSRRSLPRGTRGFIAAPALIGLIALTGCSPDAWPDFSPTETPTPESTIVVSENQAQPVVTDAQAARILERIGETVTQADTALDIDLASQRLDGPALESRRTNYTLRAAIDTYAAPAPITTSPIEVLLPQAYDGWPRTFLAVVEDSESKAATVLTVTQEDPWSDYKIGYSAQLGADTELPDLAPAYVGAAPVPPTSPFLVIAPDQVATAYADLIDKGAESEYAPLFSEADDPLRTYITSDRESRLAVFNETGAETGTLTFSTVVPESPIVSFTTVDSGAIVAVTLTEREVVRPTNADAVIKLPETNQAGRELTGKEESATGFQTDFLDQIILYIPSEVAGGQVRVLGYSSSLLGVSEVTE